MNLDQQIDQAAHVAEVAAYEPTSTEQAVAAYLHWRRKQIVNGLWTESSFDAMRDRHRAAALARMAEHFGIVSDEKKPKCKKSESKMPLVTIDKLENENTLQQAIRLSALLTPTGWETFYPSKLQELIDTAGEAILSGADGVEANQAIGFESNCFLSFLTTVSVGGQQARAEINRSARKVVSPSWGNRGPLNIRRTAP